MLLAPKANEPPRFRRTARKLLRFRACSNYGVTMSIFRLFADCSAVAALMIALDK